MGQTRAGFRHVPICATAQSPPPPKWPYTTRVKKRRVPKLSLLMILCWSWRMIHSLCSENTNYKQWTYCIIRRTALLFVEVGPTVESRNFGIQGGSRKSSLVYESIYILGYVVQTTLHHHSLYVSEFQKHGIAVKNLSDNWVIIKLKVAAKHYMRMANA